MDNLFKSNKGWPTLQNFSKKDNVARLMFNSKEDALKAKKKTLKQTQTLNRQ